MKLEPWIFKRMDQDLREILLRSSNVENDDENHHELLRYSGRIKRGKVEPKMKRIWKWPWRRHVTDDNSFLHQTLKRILEALGKWEESGKILGKDLWVRAHSKENTVERFWREIAPVELNGLNEITTSKSLERIEKGNVNLLRYLVHSGTNEWREVDD